MSGPILWMVGVGFLYVMGLSMVFRSPKLRGRHMAFMSVAVAADIGLTLWLELNRGVFDQAFGDAGFEHNRTLLFFFHIPFAVLLILCYLFMVPSGVMLARRKGKRSFWAPWHKRIGYLALSFYGASFLTAPGFLIDRAVHWLA